MSNFNTGDKVYTIGDIDRLERENAKLKAQVEQLQSIADAFIENIEEVTELLSAYGDAPNIVLLVDALNQIADDIEALPTPAQCLAEVKARAVEDAASALKKLPSIFQTGSKEFNNGAEVSAEFLLSCANQLRQQANPFVKINKARDEAKAALDNWVGGEL
jgi:hypothetical protein